MELPYIVGKLVGSVLDFSVVNRRRENQPENQTAALPVSSTWKDHEKSEKEESFECFKS